MNIEIILIPSLQFPVHHWANQVSEVEVFLTLKECKALLRSLGAGTYTWAAPENYECGETVLSFLNRNMALAQEVRLRALGLY